MNAVPPTPVALPEDLTPLQRDVNRLLRILLLVVLFFGIILVLALWVLELRVDAWLQAHRRDVLARRLFGILDALVE